MLFKACHIFSLNIDVHQTEDQFDIIRRVKSTLKILLIAVAYALFLICSKSSAEVGINFRISIRKAKIPVCHQGKGKEQYSHKISYGEEKQTVFPFSMNKQKMLWKMSEKLEEKESRNILAMMSFH